MNEKANAPMIRADAPELLALVEAAKGLLFAHDHGNGLEGWHNTRERLRAALAAWEAIALKPATDALTPWGVQPDGSGLDPAKLPIHRGGKAGENV